MAAAFKTLETRVHVLRPDFYDDGPKFWLRIHSFTFELPDISFRFLCGYEVLLPLISI
jgi:hypothetical protein